MIGLESRRTERTAMLDARDALPVATIWALSL